MKEINKKVLEMQPSGIRKFFDIVSQMKDVISLGVGEPDFVTPWQMTAAAIKSLENGKTSYTSNLGLLELRKAISKYNEDFLGVHYNPENQILITVGVSEGMDLVFRTILEIGDEVIVPQPCYVSYIPCIEMAGGIPVIVDCKEENNFAIDINDFKNAITEKTKAVLFNYPSNPTGAVADKKLICEIVKICKKHDLYIISDEVYERLCYDSEHVSFLSASDAYERTILLNGFSKSFAMTGWRIGYACGPKDIIHCMMKIHQYTMLSAPTQGQYCALEGITHCIKESDKMIEAYSQRRNVIIHGLNKAGLKCHMPGGAFYAFPSIKNTNLSSEVFCERLLFEKKVAAVQGNAFGKCGEGYIRCSYATNISKINIALERINEFTESLK